MADERLDPDELLSIVGDDPHRPARGQLKIFFGACAGVGKTYAMLQAAHQMQRSGVAVGIGVVETHGRNETEALTHGLTVLPRRCQTVNGRLATEFDLDAALASELQLVIVDELAHSNLSGSRHAKRWQDIEELLDAGIDVYTALNVQHLESLNDIVSGIVGVRVRETVPDRVFDLAAEVILVDLPTDDLLSRLSAGKVYLPPSAAQAKENFFRRGNLIALRELALRRVADRVNADVRSYRISNAIRKVWRTREMLMVCVGADASHDALIREGARLAKHMQTPWIVLHVDLPRESNDAKAQGVLLHLADCAKRLGGEFCSIPAQDTVQAILNYSKRRNVTKLILGNRVSRARFLFKPRLTERVARSNPEIDLLLINVADDPTQRARLTLGGHANLATSVGIATGVCVITTLIASGLLRVFDLSNVVMLFLIAVVLVALRLGRIAGVWASVVAVASFDYFFVEPTFSFAVTDTQYLFSFGLMLAVALIVGQLTAKLRAEARIARDGERNASALVRVTRDLAGAIALEQIVEVCRETIQPLFETEVALIVPDAGGHLVATCEAPFVDLSVAQWSFDHDEESGHGTQTLNAASALYLPLKGPMAPRGVLAVLPNVGTVASAANSRRLLGACCAAIGQALERIHFVEVAQDTIVRIEGEKMRNTLLSAVSHDLKTPLTAIRGLAETLEHPEGMAESDRIDLARSIRVESDELRRLVANLLDLARMQSEGVNLQKDWHPLSEILGSALARSAGGLRPRTVEMDLLSEVLLVHVDALLMERVIINIFDNAAKYTPPGTRMAVRARLSGESIHIAIEDDGPGLPPGDPERLFESFARGKEESSIAGVGLGLALCRRIVCAHGGTISARSRLPCGSTFEIVLPYHVPPCTDCETVE
ncbi:sensor histidine kinase [Pandoraea bronchicola]|uniref:histidine kinase n=1 Tax=Pandoraea bronchicola TaxID=2508287 RepID=A0A5E5BSA2_9BURK|nr:sensor histidine kinase KdpD [Pandoraea bronchicola]VVE89171.1 osmosensitive K+ channel signal transduction histidine kinase [Pandoraea bronchicola]